jgi:hypothetical protein
MKYHKQKLLYTPDTYPDGSCYPTTYACILDMELEEVPYFNLLYFTTSKQKENFQKYIESHYKKDNYSEDVIKYNIENFENERDWLWENARKYWLLSMGYTEDYIADHKKWLEENPTREYLAHGQSPRTGHVVVYKNGEMIHDPHPSNTGLVKIDYYSYLRKIEGDYEFDRYYLKI